MKPLSIIAVEPDGDLGEVISLILASQGHQVRVWHDSQGAHAAIRGEQPDLVIVNTWLKTREDGWELLQQLWEDPATQDIPVVVCTADIPTLRERELRLRTRRRIVVEQPFDVPEFLAAVEQAAQGQSAAIS